MRACQPCPGTVNPNPTLCLSSSGDEPCSPGQWDATFEGHSASPRVMIPAARAFHQTACSGAHGFRSHRLRSLLMLCKHYQIWVKARFEIYLPRERRTIDAEARMER